MKKYKIFFILFLVSSIVYAQQYGGLVVADTPGAYGSHWHTSITITNFTDLDFKVDCTLYLSNGNSYKIELNLEAKKTISELLIDILEENGIKLDSFFGWLEIDFSNIPENIMGLSLMYTPDPNGGEGAIFAEITPLFFDVPSQGILYGLTPCGKEAAEPMALGGAIWRSNLGFVNISEKEGGVYLQCYDADSKFLASFGVSLLPKQIKQFNDVKRPDVLNIPCEMIKEPVYCIFQSQDPSALIYVYGANNNNLNNFPIYISPKKEIKWK